VFLSLLINVFLFCGSSSLESLTKVMVAKLVVARRLLREDCSFAMARRSVWKRRRYAERTAELNFTLIVIFN
jgi:hypothetical protein